jgi:hypothetical protein
LLIRLQLYWKTRKPVVSLENGKTPLFSKYTYHLFVFVQECKKFGGVLECVLFLYTRMPSLIDGVV